jgi:hypothetical protein
MRIRHLGYRAKTEGPEAYQKLRSRVNRRGQMGASGPEAKYDA